MEYCHFDLTGNKQKEQSTGLFSPVGRQPRFWQAFPQRKASISHEHRGGLQVTWEPGGDEAAICLAANSDTSSQTAGAFLHHVTPWLPGHRWPMNVLISRNSQGKENSAHLMQMATSSFLCDSLDRHTVHLWIQILLSS